MANRQQVNSSDFLKGTHEYGGLCDRLLGIPLHHPVTVRWLILLGFFFALVLTMMLSALVLLWFGVGVWGINIPVAWGFAIINFVWWIGIGHAGTLISAILLLLKQEWRTSINRLSETMTLFAVAMAGLFPLLHLGRIWKFYYLFPYPNSLGMWPQWRSPLVWDVFAVMTYGLVSLIFWYVGMVPDLATLRDTAKRKWIRKLSGILSLGWRGSARHWQNHQMLYLLLAGIATPLVVSVHSIVSLDFAISIVPGWHTTIFPPYFVAGAIYSGFAMVFTIGIIFRHIFQLQDIITDRHLDNMAKVTLVSGLVVTYGYIMEYFFGWYSANQFERYMLWNRTFGSYALLHWIQIGCNCVVLQFLWFKRIRRSPWVLFWISIFINIGMWLERYMIVISSLSRDFVPPMWHEYQATIWDWSLFIGTLGTFFLLMMLAIRFIPVIPVFEMMEYAHHKKQIKHEDKHNFEPTQLIYNQNNLYGFVAEFISSEDLIHAVEKTTAKGYKQIDAFTPFPIKDLPLKMNLKKSKIPLIVLSGALIGAVSTYSFQYYTAVIDYTWNIGGRPPHSWPSFIPLTFELGVLGGALFGFIGLWFLNRLPKLSHPLFAVNGFERATRDRFFLLIEKEDKQFEPNNTREFLEALNPISIRVVENHR